MRRNVEVETAVVAKYVVLAPLLDERARRLWAAAESRAIGFGGDALVSAATGLARQTIRRGRQELAAGLVTAGRIRRHGAGRPALEAGRPGLTAALEQLVEPLTRGDPTSPLRWTCKSRAQLTAALTKQDWRVIACPNDHGRVPALDRLASSLVVCPGASRPGDGDCRRRGRGKL